MKPIILNKYSIAAILLFGLAAVFIVLAFISLPGDIITASFVISGMVCAMTGIFTLTFSAGEPVDPRLCGILPAQTSINLWRLTHYIGHQGHAYFLPRRMTGEPRVTQFNPNSMYDGKQDFEDGAFRQKGPSGLVITPSCDLLLEEIRNRYALVIPDDKEKLSLVLREIIEDVLKLSPLVSASWSGNQVTVTFHNYSYIDGCKVVTQRFPQCCPVSPCPVCSLCGVLIAEGLDTVVMLDGCTISSSSGDVSAVFSVLPHPGESNRTLK
jgi:hypothetical protein